MAQRWYAKGTQNYTCTAKPDGSGAEWKLSGPDAKLYASPDEGAAQVGVHGAGPSWDAKDGTRFVGNGAAAKKVASPDASAIPWLLVPKKEGDVSGTLGGVEFVQRIDTVGGQPPGDGLRREHRRRDGESLLLGDVRLLPRRRLTARGRGPPETTAPALL